MHWEAKHVESKKARKAITETKKAHEATTAKDTEIEELKRENGSLQAIMGCQEFELEEFKSTRTADETACRDMIEDLKSNVK